MVQKFLEKQAGWDFEISTVTEPTPLGTGGALVYSSSFCTTDLLLVINGDTLLQVDLSQFIESHIRTGLAASIMCAAVDDTSRSGKVTITNGRVTEFREKEESTGKMSYTNAGAYLFDRKLINQLPIPNSCSLEKDLLPLILEYGLSAFTKGVRFLDIGTPENLVLANKSWNEYGSSTLP